MRCSKADSATHSCAAGAPPPGSPLSPTYGTLQRIKIHLLLIWRAYIQYLSLSCARAGISNVRHSSAALKRTEDKRTRGQRTEASLTEPSLQHRDAFVVWGSRVIFLPCGPDNHILFNRLESLSDETQSTGRVVRAWWASVSTTSEEHEPIQTPHSLQHDTDRPVSRGRGDETINGSESATIGLSRHR